jgi:hypothetical protein
LSDLPTVHFQYAGDGSRAQIVFQNGDSEELLVTPLGSDLYRLEESSFCGDMRYRDVICAITREDGALIFEAVVARSELANESWVLSKEIMAPKIVGVFVVASSIPFRASSLMPALARDCTALSNWRSSMSASREMRGRPTTNSGHFGSSIQRGNTTRVTSERWQMISLPAVTFAWAVTRSFRPNNGGQR